MPNLDGYDFFNMLRANSIMHTIPIIFLTAKGMTDDRIKGYDLGCNAYLTKPFNPRELVSIINNVFYHTKAINNKDKKDENVIFQSVLGSSVNINEIRQGLTYREQTIMKLVARGFMNKEIAANLNVSTRNVEKYVSRLLSKTSTRNRTELAQFITINNVNLFEGE